MMGQKIESALKIHASRGWREMHRNQFWWVWPLQFQSYGSFIVPSQMAKISLWTIGGGTRGARGAIAPLDLKLEGLSPPSVSLFALIRLQ